MSRVLCSGITPALLHIWVFLNRFRVWRLAHLQIGQGSSFLDVFSCILTQLGYMVPRLTDVW